MFLRCKLSNFPDKLTVLALFPINVVGMILAVGAVSWICVVLVGRIAWSHNESKVMRTAATFPEVCGDPTHTLYWWKRLALLALMKPAGSYRLEFSLLVG